MTQPSTAISAVAAVIAAIAFGTSKRNMDITSAPFMGEVYFEMRQTIIWAIEEEQLDIAYETDLLKESFSYLRGPAN